MSQLHKLGKIAVAGFATCCTTFFLFDYTLSRTLINSKFGKDAMELVNNHNGAKFFLGEPIKPISAKFINYVKDSPTSNVQISVSGPKSKGEVFLTLNRYPEPEIHAIHLQIGKDDSKRLEISSEVETLSASNEVVTH